MTHQMSQVWLAFTSIFFVFKSGFDLQDTHCFSFDYRRVSLRDKPTNTTSTTEEQSLPAELRIYVLDVDNSVSMQPVWISPNVNQSDWLTVYLAVNPQLYQVWSVLNIYFFSKLVLHMKPTHLFKVSCKIVLNFFISGNVVHLFT